jgi:hydroxymethylbilane synthase
MRLRISARKSDLARLQAYMVGEALQKAHLGLEIEYKFKESLGDKNLTDPLWKIPEKGVFTQDFHAELLNNETDLVVHSWKDLPTEPKTDTEIVATLPRADQRDLLLVKKSSLSQVRESGILNIFSSSPRREYNLKGFLKTHWPFELKDVKFENVRGNIPTRLRKLLETPETHGLIVAKAALDRLLWAPHAEFSEMREKMRQDLQTLNWMVMPLSINPNAAAQGALAVEIAAHRPELKPFLAAINDPETFLAAQKERDTLASFGGGCHQKIGVAVLRRPYGEVFFLQGLTDQGQKLDARQLTNSSQKAAKGSLGEVSVSQTRNPLEVAPPQTEALFVARADAWLESWPARFGEGHYVWAAGLKTWQNLARKGIWVHGCTDSLGEQEVPSLDILAGKSLKWTKLTHTEGFGHGEEDVLATYSLKQEVTIPDLNKESFFWGSGSQFIAALKKYPSLKEKNHGCGPGNTYAMIREALGSHFDVKKVQIFLDQDDWRKQCQ